jgi:hypothetical protein
MVQGYKVKPNEYGPTLAGERAMMTQGKRMKNDGGSTTTPVVAEAGHIALLFRVIQSYTLPKDASLDFTSLLSHHGNGVVPLSLRRLGPRRIDPSLVPLGQFCNDVLFYLLCVTSLIDCIWRNTQPGSGHIARCGALMIARNKYYLVFSSMKVVSDNEMVSKAL